MTTQRMTSAALTQLLATFLILLYLPVLRAENDARKMLDTQREALTDAIKRGDAAGVAAIFTTDAKVMVQGLPTVTGRDAIQKFWQAGFRGGFIKKIRFAPSDFTGDARDLLVETGTFATLEENGNEKEQSRYLIVWKREEGQWRIHRDVINSEPPPGPKVDRVGFPKDYRTEFKVLGVPMRTNASPEMVLTAYGNALAASVTNAAQLPYPNGAIIVMEFARVLRDAEGKALLDANGQRQKGEVDHIDVMRRGEGFGEAYGSNRSGQWEYAGYFLDGCYSTPPAKTASCAQCHQTAGAAKDFVFPLKQSEGKNK